MFTTQEWDSLLSHVPDDRTSEEIRAEIKEFLDTGIFEV